MNFSGSVNNQNVNEQYTIPGGPPTYFATIPEYITVHLGNPNEDAENVTIPFIDYIKNVASSELYPTWPENALRANIHAIVSVALNRIALEWYKAKGYNFDITNSTQYDQAYVNNRGIFDNISNIADEIFNQYIVRDGQVLPLYTTFCDGRVSTCDGLHQWGSVDLANEGFSAIDILKYYYGENISLVTDIPISSVGLAYPGEPIKLGDSSIVVLRQQLGLNRISDNFPAIPEIYPADGYFGESTELAVKEFQRVFNLPVTGIIDQATFYKIRQIYTAVSKLSELTVPGSIYEEIYEITRNILLQGDIRPRVTYLQYFLDVLSLYYPSIPSVAYTGIFDEQTRQGVLEFQKIMGLPATGIVDSETWNQLYNSILGIFNLLSPENVYLPRLRYPGIELRRGMLQEQPGVFILQQMLSYIALVIPSIPPITVSGIFDEETENAVMAFQTMFGLEPTGIVDEASWNEIARIYSEQRFNGLIAPQEII
jgi:peptidoglycan hydrolase-like protein with peptidoglycan-binding domain